MLVYPNLNTIFLVLHLFSYFFIFLFSSAAIYSTFKPLKVLYSEFEQLKVTGRILMRLKSGVPDWGIPFNRVLQNFELSDR